MTMKKTRHQDTEEYTVVWDGRVDGADSDLLNHNLRINHNRVATPVAPVSRYALQRRACQDILILLAHQTEGVTVLFIRSRLGLTESMARTSLSGLVACGGITKTKGRSDFGLASHVYRLTAAVLAGLSPPSDPAA